MENPELLMENKEWQTSLEQQFKQMEEVDKLKAEITLKAIKETIDKVNKKQELIDELDYEKDLILQDAIKRVRENLRDSYYNIFRYMNGDIFSKAWRYMLHKKNGTLESLKKQDEEGFKDDETTFGFVTRTIKNCLIPEKYQDVELKEIIDCSYATSYEFYYKIENLEFIIEVPVFDHASQDTYKELICGYKLRQEEGCCISLEFSELNPYKFKDKLEEWLDEKLQKSHLLKN